jgi:trans-aconitate methyltransferase
LSTDHITQLYRAALHEHGDSPAAVLWPKGRQHERFHALTRHIALEGEFSLLDFGCGLAHLKPFIDQRYTNVAYTGVDTVSEFIELAHRKYEDSTFLQLNSPDALREDYDFIVASGVFNICYLPDLKNNRDLVFKMLSQLFARTRTYLSINFMTDEVDYRQDGAYHQNVTELCNFVNSQLSIRLVLDQSYMPYEYTITIWKNQQIQRPENLYV